MLHYDFSQTTEHAIMPKNEEEVLDDFLRMRINKVQFDTYRAKVKKLTGVDHPDFTRSLIEAFNEGRVSIKLDTDQKQLFGETYNVH
jgi:hypothetical protein